MSTRSSRVARNALGALAAAGWAVASLGAAAQAPIRVPVLDASVERSLGRAAERIAGAIAKLHIERYAPTRAAEQGSRQDRRQARQGLGLDRGEGAMFERYSTRPRGPVTGVVVRRGVVLTSRFNVDGPIRRIEVELADGRVARGQVRGWDASLDLAAITFEPGRSRVEPIALAPVDTPPVGSFIAVVGSSWGRMPITVNPGIISAHDRLGGRAVQLNSHLNYGNSGGVVIDLDGRVVAIAGHVDPLTRTGLNSGVGFATPVRRVLEVVDDLVAGKRIDRDDAPFLGVGVAAAGDDRVVLTQIHPGSGADQAGLEVGDQLRSIGGTRIVEPGDLRLALARLRAGQTVEVVVEREGRVLRVEARLGTRE